LDVWRNYEEIEQLFSGYSATSLRSILRQLLQHTLLIEKDSDQAKREADLETWSIWEPEARFFHFATKHAFQFGAALPDENKFSRALLRERAQPALIKRYRRADRIPLPDADPSLNSEFPRVLLGRRTVRQFGRGQISLEQLSILLWLTWGVTGRLRWPNLGKLLLKTSPSGGARHPIESYCWSTAPRFLS